LCLIDEACFCCNWPAQCRVISHRDSSACTVRLQPLPANCSFSPQSSLIKRSKWWVPTLSLSIQNMKHIMFVLRNSIKDDCTDRDHVDWRICLTATRGVQVM
jgi:hypothetical protein